MILLMSAQVKKTYEELLEADRRFIMKNQYAEMLRQMLGGGGLSGLGQQPANRQELEETQRQILAQMNEISQRRQLQQQIALANEALQQQNDVGKLYAFINQASIEEAMKNLLYQQPQIMIPPQQEPVIPTYGQMEPQEAPFWQVPFKQMTEPAVQRPTNFPTIGEIINLLMANRERAQEILELVRAFLATPAPAVTAPGTRGRRVISLEDE